MTLVGIDPFSGSCLAGAGITERNVFHADLANLLVFSLGFAHDERIDSAYKEHVSSLKGTLVQRSRTKVGNNQSSKTIIIILVDDRKMMIHPVPVPGIKAHSPDIKAVGCNLDILDGGKLTGNCADIVAEKHGIGTKDLVAYSILLSVALDHRVHYPIVIVLGGITPIEAQNSIVEVTVNDRVCHGQKEAMPEAVIVLIGTPLYVPLKCQTAVR